MIQTRSRGAARLFPSSWSARGEREIMLGQALSSLFTAWKHSQDFTEPVASAAISELLSHTLGEVGLGNLTLEWQVLLDISDAQNRCTRRFSSFAIQLLGSFGVLILKCEFA